jgi:hypothetical protein
MKKILNGLGALFLIVTVSLAIFAPYLCIDFLAFIAGRLRILATALGDRIPQDGASA